jgi:broad specificity phosphatase PhoE
MAATPIQAPPRQILIIRHAEKPGDPSVDDQSDGPNLSSRGQERAQALATFIPATFGSPDFLFATMVSPSSNRPVETITPLANGIGRDINSKHTDAEYDVVSDHLLNQTRYGGKLVLVCWHHGRIPDLAVALGAPGAPRHWPGTVFDRVWKIDYSSGKAVFSNLPQHLLPGDSAT